ncbi:hypothetical protein CXR04_27195 [Streptomyces sp. CMB-StM0423]|nr:hypothetical protein CXR04_27195 [Streptomyces sp. CMB-StM0423]
MTGDHLTIDVLRYPGPDMCPGDPDGVWLLRFFPSGINHLLTAGDANFTSVLRYYSRRPLIIAGHPVRPSVPSPSCHKPGFGTPPPHRPAGRQFISARPL